ncbi:ABC transporter ATP-binding protein [cf. Phormidesmis sp. LEGE 11477]|uniref:ABC transporter ATP-binding protein n=1 Tax=cf. Phormidesmis sp. LEGE 11477 TaxID=1828680 RepID=UPI0018812269|nr:ABC transporter ATP-binding protein [cf. Phormidesmis sp. LEGE 11477]MBE9063684.1 ABC transporter ATP-binding protein [cf. Phormidesmis sp. LEGE 11477]
MTSASKNKSNLDAEHGKSRSIKSDWRLFLRLLPYIQQHRSQLILPMLLLVPLSLAQAVQPILIGQAISLIKQEDRAWNVLTTMSLRTGLNWIIVGLLVAITVRLPLDGWQSYQIQKVGQNITASIRRDLFKHVTDLSMGFFDRTPVGRLITRLTSDVNALGDVFSTGAIGIISDLFLILVLMGAMLQQEWRLGLMLIIMLLPITTLIIYFQQQYRKANYIAREELSALNSNLQENISGINVVQLFRRERFNSELFRTINQRYVGAVDTTIFYDSAVSATLEWVALAAIAGVLALGGYLVTGNVIEIGILTTFILFAQRLFNPLRQFADKFTAIQAGLTAVERLNDLMSEPIAIRDAKNPVELPAQTLKDSDVVIPGEIRFKNVSFGYKADDYVLKNLDFTIRPGEKVALVGPTGAGKSSIIRLLCRLYEVSDGQILLDGVDIREIAQQDLRDRMAIILQDGFLFSGDVTRNITLGEDYSFEQVQRAAEQTNVATFIEALPQGYGTALRERGTNLSGGQKQLLAFARAAIRNPGILVLDEATANLDVGTEATIQAALDKLLENRTAIIIAHRLSTIRNVDRILVLKQGQLVEQGSHDELLKQDGLYASLYKLQMLGQ